MHPRRPRPTREARRARPALALVALALTASLLGGTPPGAAADGEGAPGTLAAPVGSPDVAPAGPPVAARAMTSGRAVDQSWGVPASARITVLGRGFGHGRGMSQYGAEGAARQGLDHRRILSFYYPGLEFGTVRGRVSVQISDDADDELVVVARRGLGVRGLPDGTRSALPAGAERWRLRPAGEGRTAVEQYADGRWRGWRVLPGEAEFFAGGEPIELVTADGTPAYRGRLRSAYAGGGTRDTVNVLRLENYLRGVVPLEIPALWSREAVRAQAVAARSYAGYERAHPKAAHYQLCDTSACQVYGGADVEHPASDDAVRATARLGLLDDGAPAFTQFASSSGGWTSAGAFSYLPAKEDPYDGWSGNPVHDWSVPLTDQSFEAAYPAVGDLRSLRISQRDGNGQWRGRVERLTLSGTGGSVTVSGDDVRYRLGLRSSWFSFRVAQR